LEDPSQLAWLLEPVCLQPARGLVRYLIDVRHERCCDCPSGTRTLSVWVTESGRGELVSWCAHCFNATCDPVLLEERHRQQFRILKKTLATPRQGVPPRWHAVRPALDDLRKRGLL
jgi:hypothetical protein